MGVGATRLQLVPLAVLVLALGWAPAPAFAQPNARLIISEFRLRGPSGDHDEFVEIYNPSNSPVTITTTAPSTGYSLVASDGFVRFIIPNGTVIPARGHFLGVNAVAYSLDGYPAGVGSTAIGDATYSADIPDNAGIALFKTSIPANYTLANRLDAFGSTVEANTLYKEGAGYPPIMPYNIDCSFTRSLLDGFPKDTDNNGADFVFVDTNGTSAGAGQRLGSPGPENKSSPVQTGSGFIVGLLDGSSATMASPNFERSFTSDPPNNSTFGTVSIRRRIYNYTGTNVTRLRLRVAFVNTFPSPSGVADLRPRTSGDITVATSGGSTLVHGTTLEQPPSQPNGGGFNSTFSVPLGAPLVPNSEVTIQLLFGVQQAGTYLMTLNVEALPTGGASTEQIAGHTDGTCQATLSPEYSGYRGVVSGGTVNITIGAGCNWSVTQTPSFATLTTPASGTSSGAISFLLSAAGRALRTANFIVGNAVAHIRQLGRTPSDFESDGRQDVVVYRPGTGQWWIARSSSSFTASTVVTWGVSGLGDQPVPADFDGDGKTDPAVFRLTGGSGTWLVDKSSSSYSTSLTVNWGTTGDQPVPGYYDADLLADPAVYRPSTNQWLISRSSTSYTGSIAVTWGAAGDIPVPADYDGDGRTDIAVYRPSTGQWFIKRSDSEFTAYDVVTWGAPGDVPMPGDYDGDGKADVAVWRPSTGYWYMKESVTGNYNYLSTQWGVAGLGDVPMPGDYDGDGRTDPAIYRPSTGQWFMLRSLTNYTTSTLVPWGLASDVPIRER